MIIPKHWQSWYERLDCDFPRDWDGKIDVKSRLNGKDERQRYGAAFELYLYCLLKDKGLVVDFQPGVESADPDFLIRDMRGRNVYVEAGALFNHPLERICGNDIFAEPIGRRLSQIKSRDFLWFDLEPSGNPGNVKHADVVSKVRDWVNNVSPNADRWELENTFKFGEWKLHAVLEPKSPAVKKQYGDEMFSDYHVERWGFGGTYWDRPQSRLKTKLEEKSKQVGKAGGLSIVAITGRYERLASRVVQDALYGSRDNHGGLWNGDGRNKETIAVLIHQGDLAHYPCSEPMLWIGPETDDCSIPEPLFSLKIGNKNKAT